MFNNAVFQDRLINLRRRDERVSKKKRKNKRKGVKLTMEKSYCIIIEFRSKAICSPPTPIQYPENLSNSVNIILLFLLRETLGDCNIFLHCFEKRCIKPLLKQRQCQKAKHLWLVPCLFSVVLIRPFQL